MDQAKAAAAHVQEVIPGASGADAGGEGASGGGGGDGGLLESAKQAASVRRGAWGGA